MIIDEGKTLFVWMTVPSVLFVGCGETGGEDCVTVESTVTEDTTFSGCVEAPDGIVADGDYLVTVEPGTTITFGENANFIMRTGARLNAVGTEDEPIVFTGQNDTRSFWGGVKFIATQSTENQLDWVTIENGGRAAGDSGAANAALDLNDWGGPVQVSVTNSTFTGSEGFGVRLGDESEFSEFTGNTVTGNGKTARVTKRSAQFLDDDNEMTGNDEDVIDMDGGGLVVESTWPMISGNEYFIIDAVTISGQDENEGALTIEAGVTARFEENTHLLAARGGTLRAEGTADAPIVLAGNEAIAGYWGGVGFITTQSTSNVLRHVTVADAGGQGFGGWAGFAEPAAISLNNWGGPVVVSIADVTVSNSNSNGIFVRENAADINIDDCSNLTFEQVSGSNFIPTEADCS